MRCKDGRKDRGFQGGPAGDVQPLRHRRGRGCQQREFRGEEGRLEDEGRGGHLRQDHKGPWEGAHGEVQEGPPGGCPGDCSGDKASASLEGATG